MTNNAFRAPGDGRSVTTMTTTTRLMRTGAMCPGAPEAWAPFGGVSGYDAHGVDGIPSNVATPGNPLSR